MELAKVIKLVHSELLILILTIIVYDFSLILILID